MPSLKFYQPTKSSKILSTWDSKKFQLPRCTRIKGTMTDLLLILLKLTNSEKNRNIFDLIKLGHNQDNDHRILRCMKLSRPHISHQCKNRRDTAATYANCGGPHSARIKGCKATPRASPAKPARPAQHVKTAARSSQ